MKAAPLPPLSSGATGFHDDRGQWVCTGYDSGGAYWGTYSAKAGGMYRAIGDCAEVRAEVFVRALNRDEAKGKVRAYLPGATFFR